MNTEKPADRIKHATLVEALSAAQGELPEIAKTRTANVKTKTGSDYSYRYADLADVSAAVLPILARHGLAFICSTRMLESGFILDYALRHESGDSIVGVYPLPDPTRYTAQEVGSAISYAKRYALCAVTGAAPRGDDKDMPKTTAGRMRQAAEEIRESPEWQAEQAAKWQPILERALTLTDARAIQQLITDEMRRAPGDVKRAVMAHLNAVRNGHVPDTSYVPDTGAMFPEGNPS